LRSVSAFGRERPSRLPIPAARITICVVTGVSSFVCCTAGRSSRIHPYVVLGTRRCAAESLSTHMGTTWEVRCSFSFRDKSARGRPGSVSSEGMIPSEGGESVPGGLIRGTGGDRAHHPHDDAPTPVWL